MSNEEPNPTLRQTDVICWAVKLVETLINERMIVKEKKGGDYDL